MWCLEEAVWIAIPIWTCHTDFRAQSHKTTCRFPEDQMFCGWDLNLIRELSEIGALGKVRCRGNLLTSLRPHNDNFEPRIELAAATWNIGGIRFDDNGFHRSCRHCAKAGPKTLAIQLAQDAIPHPLQLHFYDPLARSSRTCLFARTAGGIWTSVSRCWEFHEMDADIGSTGGCTLRCWYDLMTI